MRLAELRQLLAEMGIEPRAGEPINYMSFSHSLVAEATQRAIGVLMAERREPVTGATLGDSQVRLQALAMAKDVANRTNGDVLTIAEQFEAYLRGESTRAD